MMVEKLGWQFTDKHILVVGGNGFIGKHLVKTLLKCGAVVTILGLRDAPFFNDAEYVVADISNVCSLKSILQNRRFDYVFNLGGYINHHALTSGGQEVFTAHSQGVINLIKVVNWAGLKAFVQVGSSDEYGNAEAPQKESLREAPISPYSLGKTCATHFIQMLARTENFPGVVLRLFLVYGPGQNKNRFLPAIIEHCLNDREFAASEGRQLRDFCYVEDIVKGMLLAAVTEAAFGKVINLASGVPISIRKVIEMAMNLIKGGHPLFGEHPYRPGENMALYADISLAKTLLGWRPEVSLEDGLKKTIASMTGDVN